MGKSLLTTTDSKDVKKSRKKSMQAAVTVVVSEDITTTPKESIMETDPPTKLVVDGIDTETMFENKKALKRAIRAARIRRTAEGDTSTQVDSAESSKKRKYRTEDANGRNPSKSAEPPKKKHKNRTEFADPRDDTTLSPQSSKGMYRFSSMNRPSKWKFNKARQNWLIRNIWAPEALPDVYVPLVVKYLVNVQGGSKEKLIETCQSYLKVEEKTEPEQNGASSSTTTDPATPSVVASLKSILKPTPGPLIDAPSAPPPAAPEGSDAATPGSNVSIASPLSVIALADTRRTRAQTLLDAFNRS
ncbi:hypothetical protein CVT25_011164 [Psilocybe cyanescens]|uniref:WKF domain-containing protein n=1 Tax=Psilocybe cyanescens TaxID=93625 RepID=A0A409WGV0_PSICY|nr:hypothetical protein CVT25_011164 [Psilocybe cyanescens]